MRYFILFLAVLISGCNGSDDDSMLATRTQLPPNESTQVAALRAEVRQIQLIGRPVGSPVEKTDQIETFRMLGEPTLVPAAVTVTGKFGTCPNMGVLVGFTNPSSSLSADPLTSTYQAFKTCMGYTYEAQVGTGNIKPAERIFWDGPNCTGNLLEWEAGGAGYNTQTLQHGVVFISPDDGTTELMVTAGQTPKPILIQSVMLSVNQVCQSDIETQPMYTVSPYDLQTTGVALGSVGPYTLASP